MFRFHPIDHLCVGSCILGLGVYAYFGGFFAREQVMEISILAILAISLDLMAGFAGMVSLMQAALMGLAAYIFGVSAVLYGITAWQASIAALTLLPILGAIMGYITAQSRGIYFIMVTLAFGQMAYTLLFRQQQFGGDDGLSGIPRWDFSNIGINLNKSLEFSMLSLVMLILAYALAVMIVRSNLGQSAQAQDKNDLRCRSLGYRVTLIRMLVFAFSSLLAAWAGLMAAQHTQFISPELLHWTASGEVLIVVIFGGLGTIVGAVLGATGLVLLKHQINDFTDYWHLVIGIILIIVVMMNKRGLYGQFRHFALSCIRKNHA